MFSLNMEMSFERKIASRGWHVYGKTLWQNPRRDENLEAKKEDNEEATKIDSYAIAWTVKRKDKLIPVVVGHISREIYKVYKILS